MRILVTGSSGFIGKASVDNLMRHGQIVFGMDRSGTMRHDITVPKFTLREVERVRPDVILHLAANSSLQKSLTDAIYDARNNVIGTLAVIGAAQQCKVKKIVFASTSAVYGPKESGVYSEDDPINPQVPYGVSKAACEMYLRCSGVSYAILRYGNVYGPGQKPLGDNILIARGLAHMLHGAPFRVNGTGNQVRDWVYVDDVAEANWLAVSSEGSGTYNIATGAGNSVNNVVTLLSLITQHKKEIKHGPPKRGELSQVIMDSSKAKLELGWQAMTGLPQGLRNTVEEAK